VHRQPAPDPRYRAPAVTMIGGMARHWAAGDGGLQVAGPCS